MEDQLYNNAWNMNFLKKDILELGHGVCQAKLDGVNTRKKSAK